MLHAVLTHKKNKIWVGKKTLGNRTPLWELPVIWSEILSLIRNFLQLSPTPPQFGRGPSLQTCATKTFRFGWVTQQACTKAKTPIGASGNTKNSHFKITHITSSLYNPVLVLYWSYGLCSQCIVLHSAFAMAYLAELSQHLKIGVTWHQSYPALKYVYLALVYLGCDWKVDLRMRNQIFSNTMWVQVNPELEF